MIYLSKFVASKRMVMKYTSTDFNKEQATAYTLLVRIGSDENALAIVDTEKRLKLVATYDPAITEREIRDVLNLDFAAVKLCLHGNRYTFVPEEVFDDPATQSYLGHLPDDGLVATSVSDIPSLGIKVLHQPDRLVTESLAVRFPDLVTYSTVQALLQGVADYGLTSDRPVLIIDKQASTVIVCAFDKSRFIYANDFDVLGMEDFTFYLLSILKHLGLEESRPDICLSGDVAEQDEIHQWALSNGSEVVFADSGALVRIAMPQELIPQQHRFLTLLGLHLCE